MDDRHQEFYYLIVSPPSPLNQESTENLFPFQIPYYYWVPNVYLTHYQMKYYPPDLNDHNHQVREYCEINYLLKVKYLLKVNYRVSIVIYDLNDRNQRVISNFDTFP